MKSYTPPDLEPYGETKYEVQFRKTFFRDCLVMLAVAFVTAMGIVLTLYVVYLKYKV